MIVLSARKILVFIIISVYCLAIGFVKASIFRHFIFVIFTRSVPKKYICNSKN